MRDQATGDQSKTAWVGESYAAHRHELVRFATVLVGPDAAPDVVASAVLRVLERTGSPVASVRSYLYRAVANQARNHRRTEGRRRVREQRAAGREAAVPAPEPYPEVRAAIERLSVRQRAVVYLTYWEDLDEAAVAACLGIGTGSVRAHLARARRHLRKVLHAND